MIRNIQINESEKRELLKQHSSNKSFLIEDDVVFTNWLSPDDKYIVFMDQLIEIETKKNLGDIWKNPDNLFLFLEHLYKTSKFTSVIKEEASNFFSKRLIMEGNRDLSAIKHLIKILIKEEQNAIQWLWNKGVQGVKAVGNFVVDTAKETYTGIKNTFSQAWDGIKAAGIAISKGDFTELMAIIGRGFLWAARKLRSAAYSTVGMIVDAILIVTGIGKIGQAAIWAIIVALDLYEFINEDYENKDDPMWVRYLFFGCDVLGLVFAGAAAGGARAVIKGVFKGIASGAEAAATIAKSKPVMGIITKIVGALKDLPAKFAQFSAKLGTGFFSKLFGKASTGLGKVVDGFLNSIKSLFSKPQYRPVLIQLGLITGIGAYGEIQKEKLSDVEAKNKEIGKQNAINAASVEKQNKELGTKSDDLLATLDTGENDLEDLNAWEND
jgi:hypothetical protein